MVISWPLFVFQLPPHPPVLVHHSVVVIKLIKTNLVNKGFSLQVIVHHGKNVAYWLTFPGLLLLACSATAQDCPPSTAL